MRDVYACVRPAQDCEEGIPLAYLAGLDTCYGNFLVAMQSISTVVSIPWSTFGDLRVVAEHVASLRHAPMSAWVPDAVGLAAL